MKVFVKRNIKYNQNYDKGGHDNLGNLESKRSLSLNGRWSIRLIWVSSLLKWLCLKQKYYNLVQPWEYWESNFGAPPKRPKLRVRLFKAKQSSPQLPREDTKFLVSTAWRNLSREKVAPFALLHPPSQPAWSWPTGLPCTHSEHVLPQNSCWPSTNTHPGWSHHRWATALTVIF